jgi:hypothetical protein
MTVATHAPAPPSSASTTGSPPVGADAERKPGRGMLVGVIMAGIVISAMVMVGFIWYRWSGVREPTSAVIIDGDASLDGTTITVEGDGGPERTALNAANGYRAAVLVEPGQYRVEAKREGVVLLRRQVEVQRFQAVQFNLGRIAELQRQQPGQDPTRDGGVEGGSGAGAGTR